MRGLGARCSKRGNAKKFTYERCGSCKSTCERRERSHERFHLQHCQHSQREDKTQAYSDPCQPSKHLTCVSDTSHYDAKQEHIMMTRMQQLSASCTFSVRVRLLRFPEVESTSLFSFRVSLRDASIGMTACLLHSIICSG